MNLVTFCFWADWVALGSNEISSILLKHPTFEGVFFITQSIVYARVEASFLYNLGYISWVRVTYLIFQTQHMKTGAR